MKETPEFKVEPDAEWQRPLVSDSDRKLTRLSQIVNLNLDSLRNLINIDYQNTPESIKSAKNFVSVLLVTLRSKALLLEENSHGPEAERLRQELDKVEKMSGSFQGDEQTLRSIFLELWRVSANRK